jgi:hypothetical protein
MSKDLQASGSKAPYFSTFAQKRTAVMKNQNRYFCYLCRMTHLVIDNDSVRLLILSDSLMSNSWKCNNEWQHPGTEKLGAVKGHINMEVKSGATISDLTNILVQKYLNVDHRSMKIILVGGINDVIQGKHAQDILEDICYLKEKVKSHNKENLLSISTLPLAPKVCSLYVSELKKGTIYNLPEKKNHIETLEALNVSILAINKHEGLMFLKLNTVGVRGSGIGKKRNQKPNKKFHIDEAGEPKYFLEDGKEKAKLHFVYKIRYKLLHEVVDYLLRGLKWST